MFVIAKNIIKCPVFTYAVNCQHYTVLMVDEGSTGGMIVRGQNWSIRRKTDPPQIPHGWTQDPTWSSIETGQQLTAW